MILYHFQQNVYFGHVKVKYPYRIITQINTLSIRLRGQFSLFTLKYLVIEGA